jgi:phage FluMu protein Com
MCGKKLCKAEEGSTVDIQCPECKEQVEIVVTKETVSTKRNAQSDPKPAVV